MVQVSEVLNTSCMYCHHFRTTTESDVAPTLTGLFSKKIGSDNFRYSAALRNLSGSWSAETWRPLPRTPVLLAPMATVPVAGPQAGAGSDLLFIGSHSNISPISMRRADSLTKSGPWFCKRTPGEL
jgi:hypothetical protein